MNKIYLYVGAGADRLENFTHLDISVSKSFKKNGVDIPEIIADATKKIPLKDNSVDFIYSKDTFEHFRYFEFFNCLNECKRVLKKNGVLRFLVPDFDKMIHDYKNKVFRNNQNLKEVNKTTVYENFTDEFILNILCYEHRYIHNNDTINRILTNAGFHKIKFCYPGETKCNEIKDILFFSETGRFNDLIVECLPDTNKKQLTRLKSPFKENKYLRFINRFLEIFNLKIIKHHRSKAIFLSPNFILDKIYRLFNIKNNKNNYSEKSLTKSIFDKLKF